MVNARVAHANKLDPVLVWEETDALRRHVRIAAAIVAWHDRRYDPPDVEE